MKMLTIEVVEKLSDTTYWITGRCCREDLRIGDVLFSDIQPETKVVVVGIEVYNIKQIVLHHGYVGGVTVKLLGGDVLPDCGFLLTE